MGADLRESLPVSGEGSSHESNTRAESLCDLTFDIRLPCEPEIARRYATGRLAPKDVGKLWHR
jgi:hypothetical protein